MHPTRLARHDATTLALLALAAGLSLAILAVPQSAFRPLPTTLGSFDLGAPVPPVRAVDDPATEVDLALDFEALLDSDLESGGSVATQRGRWTTTLDHATPGGTRTVLGLEAEGSFYDFGGSRTVIPGTTDPPNDLYRAGLSGLVELPIGEQVGTFFALELELGAEDGASLGEGLAPGGIAGVRYRGSDELALSVGLAGQALLEDDPWVWPFLGLEWRMSEAVDFELLGTRAELAVALSDAWRALGVAHYDLRQYRLSDDGPLPGGALRDEEIRVTAGLERRGETVRVRALVGADVWRELTFRDDGGDLVSETEVDPGLAVELSLHLSF